MKVKAAGIKSTRDGRQETAVGRWRDHVGPFQSGRDGFQCIDLVRISRSRQQYTVCLMIDRQTGWMRHGIVAHPWPATSCAQRHYQVFIFTSNEQGNPLFAKNVPPVPGNRILKQAWSDVSRFTPLAADLRGVAPLG